MKVSVLLFSIFREKVGTDVLSIELSQEQATVADAIEQIYQAHTALRSWDEAMLVAVNCEYADRNVNLSDGDELALMPPVQGG